MSTLTNFPKSLLVMIGWGKCEMSFIEFWSQNWSLTQMIGYVSLPKRQRIYIYNSPESCLQEQFWGLNKEQFNEDGQKPLIDLIAEVS